MTTQRRVRDRVERDRSGQRVVVIGGAGRVGSMVADELRRRHRVRIADLILGDDPDGFRPIDVTDDASVRAAVAGQDAVVYLAMGRRAPWGATGGWAESHFDVNVKGLYLTLRLAAEAGVRRAVYASSLSIFDNYLERGHELEHTAPGAVDGYGLTKRLGEQVCEAAAREHGIAVTALRLCGPMPDVAWRAFSGRCPEVMTAATDVAAAFAAALDYPGTGFDTFLITGDHEQRFIDQSRTREVLGWQPMMRREPDGVAR